MSGVRVEEGPGGIHRQLLTQDSAAGNADRPGLQPDGNTDFTLHIDKNVSEMTFYVRRPEPNTSLNTKFQYPREAWEDPGWYRFENDIPRFRDFLFPGCHDLHLTREQVRWPVRTQHVQEEGLSLRFKQNAQGPSLAPSSEMPTRWRKLIWSAEDTSRSICTGVRTVGWTATGGAYQLSEVRLWPTELAMTEDTETAEQSTSFQDPNKIETAKGNFAQQTTDEERHPQQTRAEERHRALAYIFRWMPHETTPTWTEHYERCNEKDRMTWFSSCLSAIEEIYRPASEDSQAAGGRSSLGWASRESCCFL